jgi:hypothetical protein
MGLRWTIASSLLLTTTSAFAQSDPITAEVLFREGKRLMAEKKFAEACPKLAESQRLDPGTGTLLNLALCHEGEGKLVTAWSEFKEALRLSRDRPDRAKIAEERIAALEPKLPHLTIVVRARAPGLSIKVDDLPRNEATWGMALPIDPGEHKIVATAEARRSWQSTVTLSIGEKKTLEIPALDEEAPVIVPPKPVQPPIVIDTPPPPPSSSQKTIGLVVGGVGVLALGAGAFLGLQAKGKSDDADAICPGTSCPQNAVSLNEDARQMATFSDVAFIAGGVLVATGAILFFTAPKSRLTALPAGLRWRF